MARTEGVDSSTGSGKSQQQQHQQQQPQQSASTTTTGKQAQAPGSRGADQEQRLPVGREGTRRSTSLSRQQSSLLPSSIFAAPPGLLTGAFMTNPFGFMRRMSEEMNRIFESAGMGGMLIQGGGSDQASMATWMPQIEINQKGNEFLVRADLPGLKKDDVTVEVDDGFLKLSGERRQEAAEESDGFYRSERSYGSFYRAIPLPDGVNEDDISASFNDGVLEVRAPLPAQQQRRGRKVAIK